jgi:hypothetical protein
MKFYIIIASYISKEIKSYKNKIDNKITFYPCLGNKRSVTYIKKTYLDW